MKRYILCFVLFCTSLAAITSQEIKLNFGIYDLDQHLPISDVHVFIAGTTLGAVSDRSGMVRLKVPPTVTRDLIISHVTYDTYVVDPKDLSSLQSGDSIFLRPNGFDPSLLVITAKRNRNWKKNFKRFKKGLLGEGEAASKCEILNPEVLRFDDSDIKFKATAVDMLRIKNKFLGYDIDFLLTELTIDKNGSMKYRGRAKFTDHPESAHSKKIKERRKAAFRSSPVHFLVSLINDRIEEDEYEIKIRRYGGGQFTTILEPKRDDIISLDSALNVYVLKFPEFLEVTNLKVRMPLTQRKLEDSGRGSEHQKFINSVQSRQDKKDYAVSQLYKLSSSLIINKYGHIVNHEMVQEYGFWASHRLAMALPLDYQLQE